MNLYSHVVRKGETPQDAAKIFDQLAEADEIGTLTPDDMDTMAGFGLAGLGLVVFVIGFVLGAISF